MMSVKPEGVSDSIDILYSTPLNNVPDIYNMLSHNNQGVPELVNIFCDDETLSGLYNVVPTTQNPLDVSTTCQETADLFNVMSSEEAQEILNVVTSTSMNESDMFNIVSNPQDVSEIYIGPAQYDSYDALTCQTSDMYHSMPTPQMVPEAYTQVISTSEDLHQVSNLTGSTIDSHLDSTSTTPTLLEVRKPKNVRPKKQSTPKASDKSSKTQKRSSSKASGTKEKKTKPAPPVIDYCTDPETTKSQLIELHNGKRLLIVNEYPYYFRHILKTTPLNRWCCNKNSCNAYVHATLNDNIVVAFGGEAHKHLPPKFIQQDDGKYIKV